MKEEAYWQGAIAESSLAHFVMVKVFDPNKSAWVDIYNEFAPPGTVFTVPKFLKNTGVFVAFYWQNESSVELKGHVDAIITKPSTAKITLTASLNQDKIALPGNGWGVAFNAFTLDEAGKYTAQAILSVENKEAGIGSQIADTWTNQLGQTTEGGQDIWQTIAIAGVVSLGVSLLTGLVLKRR